MSQYKAHELIFKAFSDEKRLRIIDLIKNGETWLKRSAGEFDYKPVNFVSSYEGACGKRIGNIKKRRQTHNVFIISKEYYTS